MRKKSALLFMLAVFIISIAGCETAKGAMQGAKKDLQTARQTAMKGLQAVQKTDAWMRDNLW
jgi:predicted small secreted protein